MLCTAALDKSPPRRTTAYTPDQQTGKCVHDQRKHEEHQSHLNQSAEIEIACGFREFIGDHAAQRVSGGKQGARDLSAVTDHHGYRHGFAKGAPKSQDGSPETSAHALRDS